MTKELLEEWISRGCEPCVERTTRTDWTRDIEMIFGDETILEPSSLSRIANMQIDALMRFEYWLFMSTQQPYDIDNLLLEINNRKITRFSSDLFQSSMFQFDVAIDKIKVNAPSKLNQYFIWWDLVFKTSGVQLYFNPCYQEVIYPIFEALKNNKPYTEFRDFIGKPKTILPILTPLEPYKPKKVEKKLMLLSKNLTVANVESLYENVYWTWFYFSSHETYYTNNEENPPIRRIKIDKFSKECALAYDSNGNPPTNPNPRFANAIACNEERKGHPPLITIDASGISKNGTPLTEEQFVNIELKKFEPSYEASIGSELNLDANYQYKIYIDFLKKKLAQIKSTPETPTVPKMKFKQLDEELLLPSQQKPPIETNQQKQYEDLKKSISETIDTLGERKKAFRSDADKNKFVEILAKYFLRIDYNDLMDSLIILNPHTKTKFTPILKEIYFKNYHLIGGVAIINNTDFHTIVRILDPFNKIENIKETFRRGKAYL